MKNKVFNLLNWFACVGATIIVCLVLGVILYDIFSKGLPSLSWHFVLSFPTNGMTKGGILPAIIGTVVVTIITTLFAVPFGISCAIYLNEYARPSTLTNIIRACIRNLAGIPSIIYGLFGLALFVQSLNLGTSILAAGLTLGLLSLPYIITTSEEALKRVPNSMREATLALGATHFET
ncbi:MAG: ABC transporter permease subunit, partial [Chitinophagaceae bacterium]|nr:ABC transporter permease subunit [Chitinophagaceae bacterium]